MTVRVGVVLPDSVPPGEALPDVAGLARVAETAGLDGVWAEDTFAAEDRPGLDATLTLAVAAAVTSRISVGFAIFVPSLRPLGWAARQVASLQHHAGGRLWLGVGIGGGRSESEYLAVGMRRRDRAARTDDFLRLLPDLLGGEPTVIPDCSSAGTVQLLPAAPMPPVWIGGTSAAAGRARPRLGISVPACIGTAGSASSLAGVAAATMQSAYGVPASRARELAIGGTPAQVADQLAAFAGAGAELLLVQCVPVPSPESWELLGEVRQLLSVSRIHGEYR